MAGQRWQAVVLVSTAIFSVRSLSSVVEVHIAYSPLLQDLKLLKREDEEMPSLFADPVFKRSSNWVLSTSAIYCKHFGPYGWGEVRFVYLPCWTCP